MTRGEPSAAAREVVRVEKRGTHSHLWQVTISGVFVQDFAFEHTAEERADELRSALDVFAAARVAEELETRSQVDSVVRLWNRLMREMLERIASNKDSMEWWRDLDLLLNKLDALRAPRGKNV